MKHIESSSLLALKVEGATWQVTRVAVGAAAALVNTQQKWDLKAVTTEAEFCDTHSVSK